METPKDELMLIGTKESFLIRALEKKLTEAGIVSFFCSPVIDEINRKWDQAGIVTVYLDPEAYQKPDILLFINDKLMETDKKAVLVGEKIDIDVGLKYVSNSSVLKTFLRPLDTEKFIFTVAEYLRQRVMLEDRKTILIVDDDATYLGLIREWLKLDYKVAMANSGLQAIKWLGKNHADLILLDHEMPVTTGPQVLEMLRSDPETMSIPVIFLTGKSDKGSVMQVVALKPEGYLLKSIERDELLEELKKFFKASKR